ncbi:hypothetical protein LF1_58280 [Rubripirellula obstinata]|uniref:Uncharacterized protein n=1 Tax=Rubripirellula obstinata TaxID=406547 RepID=A0A5B1CA59_9BACT|nr:hypothetical protein LF1_58280 [Rubripirellula obstinata]
MGCSGAGLARLFFCLHVKSSRPENPDVIRAGALS